MTWDLDATSVIRKDIAFCEICDQERKEEQKGIEVDLLWDSSVFICLHCLIDFLTSDQQILIKPQ